MPRKSKSTGGAAPLTRAPLKRAKNKKKRPAIQGELPLQVIQQLPPLATLTQNQFHSQLPQPTVQAPQLYQQAEK